MLSQFRNATPNAQGIALLLLATTFFTLLDATAKYLITSGYPALQAVWFRYIGQTIIITALVIRGGPSLLVTRRPLHQAARSFAQLCASVFFFLSLGKIGLASATAIADTSPVLITLGAAVFLGERVGARRLIAIGVAMAGALLIVRPGSDVFTPSALLPFACAISFASFALLTRAMGPGEPLMTSLFYSSLCGTLVTTAAMPFVWHPIAAEHLAGALAIAVFGTVGQALFIQAYARASAAAIAPFGYIAIPIAAVWGIVFFGEWPDLATIVGALVIVGAGLYVWHRETTMAARRAE